MANHAYICSLPMALLITLKNIYAKLMSNYIERRMLRYHRVLFQQSVRKGHQDPKVRSIIDCIDTLK